MKQQYIDLLRSTNREGIDKVIAYLEKSSFFTAPASTNKHLAKDGGLVEHSLNVYRTLERLAGQMIEMKPGIKDRLKPDSLIISALLHDVCKANLYKKIQKFRKDANGRWETYDGYDTDYTRFPMGHGEKSVVMLLNLGLTMTKDEMLAIRWHMSAWNLAFQSYEEKCNISAAADIPLVSLLQSADVLATHIVEA